MSETIQYADFKVMIPSLEGDMIVEEIPIRVPVTICPHTGEEMLTPDAFELIETTKARYMGLLLPDEIKSIRLRHRLSQKEMSELLQAGEKSYSRWETGRARPSRVINVLLRALEDGKVTVEWLRAQRARNFLWSKVVRPGFQQRRAEQPAVYFSITPEESPPLPLMDANHETLATAA